MTRFSWGVILLIIAKQSWMNWNEKVRVEGYQIKLSFVLAVPDGFGNYRKKV